MANGTWDAIPARVRSFTRDGQSHPVSGAGFSRLLYNAERGLWAFYCDQKSKWWISASLSCSYKTDGGIVLTRQFGTHFGRAVYASGTRTTDWVLFFSVCGKWILAHPRGGWVYEPHACLEPDGTTWEGDEFYTRNSGYLPFPGDAAVAFEPAGTLLNGSAQPVQLSAWWPRWERGSSNDPAPCGTYSPADQDGAPDIRIGAPTWEGDDGALYARSAEKTDGRYAYGPIRYVEEVGAWCPGGNTSIRGPEPTEGGSASYTVFDAAGEDTGTVALVLSWKGLTKGAAVKKRLFAEMFGWKL